MTLLATLLPPFSRAENSAVHRETFKLTDEAKKALGRRWTGLSKPNGNPGVRDLFEFALDAAAHRYDPPAIEQALSLAKQMRALDPQAKLYGNYRWSWNDAGPDDPNAVEFSMQYASLAWLLYRDALTAKARTQLEDEIGYSLAGIRNHRVPVSYTNIFLMKAANCILIGETLPNEELAKEGYALFSQWLDYTRANGIHEYSSPTYYGVDLGSLGLLAKYPRSAEARDNAQKALRLFWTEIAANWFPSFEGIAGTHSRDYDFLEGHGLLDRYLENAGWISTNKGNPSEAFFDLSAWMPPADLRSRIGVVPRLVIQRWGEKTWETSTHYVTRTFSLGTAGSGYCPQDKTLTINLALGPNRPIVNFAMDERADPYGQAKVITGGGHMKLTHLVPFTATAQQGANALLLASANPPKHRSPSAKSLESNLVFPADATVWLVDRKLDFSAGKAREDLPSGTTLFLRYGETAVALRYIAALDTAGRPAPVAVLADGLQERAMRFSAFQSEGPATGNALTALWVRAAEGLSDADFATFRNHCSKFKISFKKTGETVEISAPSDKGTLRLVADLKAEKRIRIEGTDTAETAGILTVNGQELGGDVLR